MRKVKDAVDLTTNEKIYFKGHAKATYLSDGRNVEDALAEGGADVFVAEYGVTTFEEVAAAHNAGKVVAVYNNEWVCTLERVQSSQFTFSAQAYPNIMRIICGRTSWGYASFSADHDLTKLDNGNVRIKITNQTAEVATPAYVQSLIVSTLNTEV